MAELRTPLEAIGFIGLGVMGLPLARHLLQAGHPLHVYTRSPDRAQSLLEEGATWCDDPAAVARRRSLVITVLPDAPDVEAVLFGSSGLVEGLTSGACVVDMSTIAPAAAQSFAARLAVQGVAFLDAPVTGGESGARNATLTIMVGGDADAFARVRPVLARLGSRIVHVGRSGSGQMMKACNQILCAVNMVGVCEALSFAKRCGLEPRAVVETLAEGAGGSWALANLGSKICDGDFAPGFKIKLMEKDLRIVQDAAQVLAVPVPGAALAQRLFQAARSTPGGGELGTQAMIRAWSTSAAAPGVEAMGQT